MFAIDGGAQKWSRVIPSALILAAIDEIAHPKQIPSGGNWRNRAGDWVTFTAEFISYR